MIAAFMIRKEDLERLGGAAISCILLNNNMPTPLRQPSCSGHCAQGSVALFNICCSASSLCYSSFGLNSSFSWYFNFSWYSLPIACWQGVKHEGICQAGYLRMAKSCSPDTTVSSKVPQLVVQAQLELQLQLVLQLRLELRFQLVLQLQQVLLRLLLAGRGSSMKEFARLVTSEGQRVFFFKINL